MRNFKIAPSILSANFANLERDIKLVEEAGAEYLHFDVMDGHFVPNISFGAPILKSIKSKTSMFIDVHLMIENPDLYIRDFVDAGADLVNVHVEACVHLHRTIQLIKSLGVKAGVTLNPATPLSTIEEILPYVDLVLLMSVNPGFGGQKYIDSVDSKISRLRKIIDDNNYHAEIQVDGGVTSENAGRIADLGADVLVAGSSIFSKPDIKRAVYEIRNAK